jgi:predicted nucleotidyltransferase component of viral defense system
VIGRPEIQRLARAGGVDERTQERDYVLTWLLAGMANQDMSLVFKGGTCLRRCYIRGYRYSEDLDFTLRQGVTPVAAADAVSAWCRFVGEEAGIQADATADDAMGARRAWVSFAGPLAARREKAIKVDLADDDEIVEAIAHLALLSEYSDLPDGKYEVPAYALAEIWAEKVRSLMQRTEPRDAYDLAQLAELDDDLAGEALAVFEQKARAKGLDPGDLGARLDAREATLQRMWADRLRDQVVEVPAFESAWRQVRRVLRQAGYHDASSVR